MTEQERLEAEKLIKESQAAYDNRDYDRVITLLRRAAALGDDLAMETLGMIYKNGDMEVEEDMQQANFYFIKAAAHGSVYAMEQLARNYRMGDGIREDKSKSVKYFQMAADNGSTYGCYRIADLYYDGEYYEQDYSKALEYFKRAVDPNAKVKSWHNTSESAAALRLGKMYEEGKGVDKDLNTAIEWYKKSVEFDGFNSINAARRLTELGVTYDTGIKEHSISENETSDMTEDSSAIDFSKCFSGEGVIQNYAEALKCLLKIDDNENHHNDIRYLVEYFIKIFAHTYKDEQFSNEMLDAQIVPLFKDKAEAGNLIYRLKKLYDKSVEKIITSGEDLKSEEDIKDIKDGLIHLAAELAQPEAMFEFGDYLYNAAPDSAFEWYLKAAELGNINAMYEVANMYEDGHGVNKNFDEAVKWLKKAASLGDLPSIQMLAYCYVLGEGVEQSDQKALELLKEYNLDDEAAAMEDMAYIYSHNVKNNAKALEYYLKAAELGADLNKSADTLNAVIDYFLAADEAEIVKLYNSKAEAGAALYKLGKMYLKMLDDSSFAKEDEIYKLAAELGNADAMAQYGYSCSWAGDDEEALKWYRKGAELGSASAMFLIGNNFYSVEPPDYKTALEWYTKAAERGHDGAMDALGEMYRDGEGVEKDLNLAFKYFKSASELGHHIAQWSLAICYVCGYGTEPDEVAALKWCLEFGREHYASNVEGEVMDDMGNLFKNNGDNSKAFEYFLKGAELGCDDAMYSLAMMYAEGEYVEKDQTKVFEWLLKAAEAGHIFAIGHVIGSYMEGAGTEKNIAEALKWAYKDIGLFKSCFKEFVDYFVSADEAEILKLYENSREAAGEALYKLATTCPKIFVVEDQEESEEAIEPDELDNEDDEEKDTPEINQEYLNKSLTLLKRAAEFGNPEALIDAE